MKTWQVHMESFAKITLSLQQVHAELKFEPAETLQIYSDLAENFWNIC